MEPDTQDAPRDMYGVRRPRTAFVLCQIGGVFNLVAGGYLLLTTVFTRYTAPFAGGGIIGYVSTAVGTLTLFLGAMLYGRPSQHTQWALLIVATSLAYWIAILFVFGQGAFSWAAFGSAYSLLGGTMGLAWRAPRLNSS